MNRKAVIEKANDLILVAPTAEARRQIQNIVSTLLLAAGAYDGFQYIQWLNGGYDKWVAAGKPKDTMQFVPDRTLIRFY
jgi:hypothetical protein